ncbi:MAG: nucleotidyltransferase domain-containing protein [Deltaproteobacteria bacterium]|nr:nucleotidyltransferase domain-containing protein [Deltaproteobacteria bacterium]
MIDLDEAYLTEIKNILSIHVPECRVWAFGSRVNGQAREYSDLDLVLVGDGPLDWRRIEAVKDAFSESELPFMVDVLDWQAISPGFRLVIEQKYELVK